ncbi:AAA family ATPase [Methanoculleus sp. MH98A]|uniref:AAA family ATPase n=1 Tax=Methanoculleus sp. MH98A TaxID=1495314 RepID=UPI0009E60A12
MTHSSLLRSDETLFRDPEVFEFTYLPGEVHHRDAQVRELAWLLRPALRGGSAGSAVLRGPPGTGKTTTVRRIFREIREETKRIVPVYVNCRHDRTPLAVYRSIFKQIFATPRRRPAGTSTASKRGSPPGSTTRMRRLLSASTTQTTSSQPEPLTSSSTRSSGSTRSGTSKSPESLQSQATLP